MSVPGPGEDGGARGRSAEWKHSKVSLPTGPAPSQPQHWRPHFQDRENIFPIPKWKGHHWGDGAGCQGENLNFRGGCSATNFTNVCGFYIYIFFYTSWKKLSLVPWGLWWIATGKPERREELHQGFPGTFWSDATLFVNPAVLWLSVICSSVHLKVLLDSMFLLFKGLLRLHDWVKCAIPIATIK